MLQVHGDNGPATFQGNMAYLPRNAVEGRCLETVAMLGLTYMWTAVVSTFYSFIVLPATASDVVLEEIHTFTTFKARLTVA